MKASLLLPFLSLLSSPLVAANDSIPVSYVHAYLTEVGFAFFDDSEGVHLDWTNPYDEAVDGYEIQRSPDGDNWSIIARLESTGEVGKPSHYEYVDTEPHTGLNLYRLLRHKTNGSSEVTHEIAVLHEEV